MKLQIFYPVKPAKVLQVFGVNGDYYRKHGINVQGHNGLDFHTYHGQPVCAAHDGVAYISKDSLEGVGVVVRTLYPYDWNGGQAHFKSIYWHLCDGMKEPQFAVPVKDGQEVRAGDLIGYADSTGFSNTDHLHFGLKPQEFDEDNRTWWNLSQQNGYYGAIDPMPHFNGYYAQDAQQTISILQKTVELLTAYVNELKLRLSKKSRLNDWAEAMKLFEGYYPPGSHPSYPKGSLSWQNKNPGNVKFASQKGAIGKDSQGHAIFDTYENGWSALIRQLTLVATGMSPVYNDYAKTLGLLNGSHLSLKQVLAKYAEGNQEQYAAFVAKRLGVSPDTKVKLFL